LVDSENEGYKALYFGQNKNKRKERFPSCEGNIKAKLDYIGTLLKISTYLNYLNYA